MNYSQLAGHVVVGVRDPDDDATLDSLLDVAVVLSRQRHAPIALLHALPHTDGLRISQTAQRVNADSTAHALMTDAARRLMLRAGHGVKSRIATSTGPPVETLVAASREAAVLVVFRRRRSVAHRLVHGFITSAVSAQAHCPVVVMLDHSADQLGYVLVGVEEGPTSTGALAFAFAQASWRGVPLVAVHAWQRTRPRMHRTASGRYEQVLPTFEQGDRTLEAALARFVGRHPDVTVRRQLMTGSLLGNVLPLTRYAQMVVIGRGADGPGPQGDADRDLKRLLRCSFCPVVIVPARSRARAVEASRSEGRVSAARMR